MNKDQKNIGPDNIITLIIVSVFLYLISFSVLGILYSFKLEKIADEQIPIVIELSDSCDEADIFRIEQFISKSNYCVPSTVKYIPKEEALIRLSAKGIKNEEIEVFDENLLANTIEFHMKSSFIGKEKEIINELKKQSAISNIISINDAYNLTQYNLRRIRIIAAFLLIFFIFATLFIIYKSNKLSFLSKDIIHNQDFAKEILKNNIRAGIFSALFAFAAILISLVCIGNQFESASFSGTSLHFSLVCIATSLTGIVLYVIAAKIATYQYTKTK